ncbi:hypothetical protein PV11_09269 [Exophiala sideris]|uniref:Xylanolytic transcriptional activator regulatory domain-containing protein n=1 Tax=Exophiala sideris TaxID=1016849 RepID=A0A0D1Y9P4_9EURO|nr:hypothetical protein PV11_09269 [Exophiala sideris]
MVNDATCTTLLRQPHDVDPVECQMGEDAFDNQLEGLDSANWLLNDNFDLNLFDFGGLDYTFNETENLSEHPELPLMASPLLQKPEPRPEPAVLDLRTIWYTQIRSMNTEYGVRSGSVTPRETGAVSRNSIDEVYRLDMASKLRPPLREEPLPSIDFLNLCIQLFFTRFNIILPLIHSPTFRPTKDNALLVLSICSAGSLSLGSEMAAKAGAMLFEICNKAVLAAPWERNHSQRPEKIRNMVKTAMIGQTFALLSGNPFHLTTAAAFLGSLITLARHSKLFQDVAAVELGDDISAQELDVIWRQWARDEELKRVALVLHIHDAEISGLFHHEPILRHNAMSLPTACSSELFSAPNATVWASRYRTELFKQRGRGGHLSPNAQAREGTDPRMIDSTSPTLQSPSSVASQSGQQQLLNVYTTLSGIGASIGECRKLSLLSPQMTTKFESDLNAWYSSVDAPFREIGNTFMRPEAPFSMLPLWHYTFLTLSETESDWEFDNFTEVELLRGGDASFLNDTISDLKHILVANRAEMKASTLCVLESILRRLGTGGIAKVFADIVQVFITEKTDRGCADVMVSRHSF